MGLLLLPVGANRRPVEAVFTIVYPAGVCAILALYRQFLLFGGELPVKPKIHEWLVFR